MNLVTKPMNLVTRPFMTYNESGLGMRLGSGARQWD